MNRRRFCKAAVAIPPLVAWKTHASLMMVSGNRAEAGAGGGGGSSSYTATHYVAPFASAAGSPANDYVDQGATVWANAASSGTPCNLGTAMARAVAGNKVQVAGGEYLSNQLTGNRWLPTWRPTNSGSSGNEIVFFAETPAATNPSSGNLSVLQNTAATQSDDVCFGVVGEGTETDYIIYDGFAVDQANGALPQNSGGQCSIGSATGVQIRRCLFLREDGLTGGDNDSGIFTQGSTDLVVSDCLFRGGNSGASSSHNDSAIQTYGCFNFTFEYCTFEANASHLMGCGIFIKGDGGSGGSDGVIRFCNFKNPSVAGAAALEINFANDSRGGVDIYQNIMRGGRGAFSIDSSNPDSGKRSQVYNNTFVDTTGDVGDSGSVIVIDPVDNISQVTFKDNIVAHRADTSSSRGLIFTRDQSNLSSAAEWDFNFYHMSEGAPRFRDFTSPSTSNTYTTLEAWVSLWGDTADVNSQYGSDPFEDYATEDFHISSGHAALTASSIGGPVGAYITGSEEIGVRASPTY